MVYFFLFAALLMGVYVAMRRQLAPFKVLAIAAIIGGIFTMTLFALNQNVIWIHALLVGFLLGGGLSSAVVMMANYFQKQEQRSGAKRSA